MDRDPGVVSPGSGRFETDLLALLPQLRRYSRSLSRSEADGEDLLQDCIETACSQRRNWRGVNLKAWTYAIMTNLSRSRFRKTSRHRHVDLEEAEHVPAPGAGTDPMARARLLTALDRLAPDQRAVLMLVVVEGHGYQEVADLLDIPIGTVMSRLSRARGQLRETLAESNIIPLRRSR